MNHRIFTSVAPFVGLSLLIAACGSSSSAAPSASSATMSINGQTANDHGTKDVSGGGSQNVEVDNYYFNPTLFTGKVGDKLSLTLSNDSQTVHNFTVTEQQINMDIPVGGKITVSVTFPASGTLAFFCKFHHTSGMVGGLKVETN